jgi:hypothetical protein
MTKWNKLKSLFVSNEGGAGQAVPDSASAGDAMLDPALEKYLVPEGTPPAPLGPQSAAQLTGSIDFQALYDQAGVPNTDEVEALEKFLGGLDDSLPQSSRLAAAKAFLGAIGKAPRDVLGDAELKIRVVRSVEATKKTEVEGTVTAHQSTIDDLQRQIDEQRGAMEAARKDLESVRQQCVAEESRLQAARIFFGAVDGLPTPK